MEMPGVCKLVAYTEDLALIAVVLWSNSVVLWCWWNQKVEVTIKSIERRNEERTKSGYKVHVTRGILDIWVNDNMIIKASQEDTRQSQDVLGVL